MKEYALYLESSPRQGKTQVHVLELLGCTANGHAADAALAAIPEAIRTYLRFLRWHGEATQPDDLFTTAIAAHVTEGNWLGNGDPECGFAPDFKPLTVLELHRYLGWLGWMQEDMLRLARGLTREQLATESRSGGRTIQRILEHVAEAHASYLQTIVGTVDGLPEVLHDIEQGPDDLPGALYKLWQITAVRMEGLTEVERTQLVVHGQVTWTARRALRRMLEHQWEHLQEITVRLHGVGAR